MADQTSLLSATGNVLFCRHSPFFFFAISLITHIYILQKSHGLGLLPTRRDHFTHTQRQSCPYVMLYFAVPVKSKLHIWLIITLTIFCIGNVFVLCQRMKRRRRRRRRRRKGWRKRRRRKDYDTDVECRISHMHLINYKIIFPQRYNRGPN